MIVYHHQLIAAFASLIRPDVYVELGLGDGDTSELVKPWAGRVVTVDNRAIKYPEFCMTTDEFMSGPVDSIGPIDMAFIDADHESSQVMRDFDGIYKRTTVNGFIFIHDTYPDGPEYCTPGYCSDSYKVPEMLKRKYGGDFIEVLTLPFHPGLTMVRKLREN